MEKNLETKYKPSDLYYGTKKHFCIKNISFKVQCFKVLYNYFTESTLFSFVRFSVEFQTGAKNSIKTLLSY